MSLHTPWGEEIPANANIQDLRKYPICPHCHEVGHPEIRFVYARFENIIEVYFTCTTEPCKKGFIGYYDKAVGSSGLSGSYTGKTSVGTPKKQITSEAIRNFSPKFENIYNEALAAEEYGLNEIAGAGYRKALEFLLKDYALARNPECEERITKSTLQVVINEYFKDTKIHTAATRTYWLGNDQTHYDKTWHYLDLDFMKKLFAVTLHWIEMELITDELPKIMPDKKDRKK